MGPDSGEMKKNSKILIVITARGGSKGIHRKNLVDICGKPLISYSITKALNASKQIEMDVLLSTEDIEIKRVAEKYGAWCPFLRPESLALDNVESFPVVKHAVEMAEQKKNYLYDIIVYINPTGVLWREVDLIKCLELLIKNDNNFESSVAITQIETHPFRMKRLLDDGRLINYIDQGFEDMRPRQTLPIVYRRAGSIYASIRSVIFEKETLVGDPCYGHIVPNETAIDIDNIVDLETAKSIINMENKND